MAHRKIEVKLSIIFFIILFTGISSFCQEDNIAKDPSLQIQKNSFDLKFGLDPNLLNGIKYNYPYANISGDPFFPARNNIGNIRINGTYFYNERIRFDILNNQVVLDYKDQSKNTQSIVLRNEWVEEFELNNLTFTKVNFKESKERLVQLIYEGRISCYYDWTKEHKLSSGAGSHFFYFTDANKKGILIMNNEELHFRKKASFLKHFQKEDKQNIKRFLKNEKIRFNKAKSAEMVKLIKYCNQI